MTSKKEFGFVPHRLCCGQQHFGPVCPDDKVMCCLCFERVTQDQLSVDETGQRWDVCIPCRDYEVSRMVEGEL